LYNTIAYIGIIWYKCCELLKLMNLTPQGQTALSE
jgi:hypothetical protein